MNHSNIELNSIKFIGRHVRKIYDEQPMEILAHACSGFELYFKAKNNQNFIDIKLYSEVIDYDKQFFNIYIDNCLIKKEEIGNGVYTFKIALNLKVGKHHLRIIKTNEACFSELGLIEVNYGGLDIITNNDRKDIIEFYGDSITNGYGNLTTGSIKDELLQVSDSSLSYGYLCAEELGYECSIVAFSGIGLAMSYNYTSEYLLDVYDKVGLTSLWDMASYEPKYIVINIGTNDLEAYNTMSEGLKVKGAKRFIANYQKLIINLKEIHPNVKIVCIFNMMIRFNDNIKDDLFDQFELLNNKYGKFIYTKEFEPDCHGGLGHPNKEAHKKFGHQLAEFIKSL